MSRNDPAFQLIINLNQWFWLGALCLATRLWPVLYFASLGPPVICARVLRHARAITFQRAEGAVSGSDRQAKVASGQKPFRMEYREAA